MAFHDGADVEALIAFLVLSSDAQAYVLHRRPLWTVVGDDPLGTICFVDCFLSDIPWSLSLHKYAKVCVKEKFPQLEKILWWRPTCGQDRLCTWYYPKPKPIPMEVDRAYALPN